MIFDRNETRDVIALLGAGSMGTAIARRIAAGKTILLGTSVRRTWRGWPATCAPAATPWRP